MSLVNALKKAKLMVFYLVFSLVLIVYKKIPQLHDHLLCCLIFRFFYLSIFFSKYRLEGFIYQTNSFDFCLLVSLRVWRLFINRPTSFPLLSFIRVLEVFYQYIAIPKLILTSIYMLAKDCVLEKK